MAKMLAAEYCNEVVQDSFRIHGGYGYSKEYEIERLYREAAFMLIGEGTSDIQKMIIGRSLLKDYRLALSASRARARWRSADLDVGGRRRATSSSVASLRLVEGDRCSGSPGRGPVDLDDVGGGVVGLGR